LVRVVDPLPVVQGDALLIGKVLANLISNGLKFNQSEIPQVEIGALAGNPPVIYVRDNGIGIPKQYHDEIFTIFRRLHGRARYEGSGAGLTIVRKIVESHGGRVWLESEPGRGTTFFFTLGPARGEATPAKPPTQPPHWATRPSHRAGRQATTGPKRTR
jgi:light-regulated signal transduction histidine kinase (bacteriophytochrome)